MILDLSFFITSIMLGVGLAMDAFSVSLANGLNEPCMKKRKTLAIAAVFALFQFAMPMVGWLCVHTVTTVFSAFERFIPWIALFLLGFIGGKMIFENVKGQCECDESAPVCFGALLIQGLATSIDALSVGFTISDYNLAEATLSCLLIGVVTLLLCLGGIEIGKKAGTRLAGKAGILGGIILIAIGIEIFITGVF